MIQCERLLHFLLSYRPLICLLWLIRATAGTYPSRQRDCVATAARSAETKGGGSPPPPPPLQYRRAHERGERPASSPVKSL